MTPTDQVKQTINNYTSARASVLVANNDQSIQQDNNSKNDQIPASTNSKAYNREQLSDIASPAKLNQVKNKLEQDYLKELSAEQNAADPEKIINQAEDQDPPVKKSLANTVLNYLTKLSTATTSASLITETITDIFKPFKFVDNLVEKIAMGATNLQATGFATSLMTKAFKTKDPILLGASMFKLMQPILSKCFGNYNGLLRLSAFAAAADQLKPALESSMEDKEYKSFGEKADAYKKAFMEVMKEMLEDPLSYLTGKPKSGKTERTLVLDSIMMASGAAGSLVSKNDTASTILGAQRHLFGFKADTTMAKMEDNDALKDAGQKYTIASIIDGLGIGFNKVKTVTGKLHKLAYIFNNKAELSYAEGV